MKYKVGDKVRINSIDWYNENKSKRGFICFDYANFIPEMSRYCGEILTINQVVEEYKQYLVSECPFSWTDEMIEGLVEEETKPELKFKVGDKVRIKDLDWYNKNKDEYGNIELSTHFFISEMSEFCGKIVTIKDVFEDIDDSVVYYMDEVDFDWTNEMIECLVERNGKTYPYKIGDRVILKKNNRYATITDLKYNSFGNLSYYIKIDNDTDISTDCPTELLLPYDDTMVENGFIEKEPTKPKFNIGDKVYSTTWQRNVIIQGIIPGGFYKVGDIHGLGWFTTHEDTLCKENVKLIDEYILPEGYIFKDDNGNEILTSKIILEKKEYPKTYKECCEILGLNDLINMHLSFMDEDTKIIASTNYHIKTLILLNCLTKLRICRDAYWKIAGEEMGLGKPWEPTKDKMVYSIYRHSNEIETDFFSGGSVTFEFPTHEMRDAFYENFKEEIESCKELL